MLLKVPPTIMEYTDSGDVNYIIHVASPFHFNVTDYNKDFYEPAIKGTTGILKEAIKEKSVKRVVITSSIAALINPTKSVIHVILS
jgi:nucleoside-diphosphate-sugar epimerase